MENKVIWSGLRRHRHECVGIRHTGRRNIEPASSGQLEMFTLSPLLLLKFLLSSAHLGGFPPVSKFRETKIRCREADLGNLLCKALGAEPDTQVALRVSCRPHHRVPAYREGKDGT